MRNCGERIFSNRQLLMRVRQDSNDNGAIIVNIATPKILFKEHDVPAPKHSLIHPDFS
jgi:hypothetical protein